MIFTYKVKYYDDFQREETEESGLTCGNDFAEAAININEYYGKDLVRILDLFALSDSPCIHTTAEFNEKVEQMNDCI